MLKSKDNKRNMRDEGVEVRVARGTSDLWNVPELRDIVSETWADIGNKSGGQRLFANASGDDQGRSMISDAMEMSNTIEDLQGQLKEQQVDMRLQNEQVRDYLEQVKQQDKQIEELLTKQEAVEAEKMQRIKKISEIAAAANYCLTQVGAPLLDVKGIEENGEELGCLGQVLDSLKVLGSEIASARGEATSKSADHVAIVVPSPSESQPNSPESQQVVQKNLLTVNSAKSKASDDSKVNVQQQLSVGSKLQTIEEESLSIFALENQLNEKDQTVRLQLIEIESLKEKLLLLEDQLNINNNLISPTTVSEMKTAATAGKGLRIPQHKIDHKDLNAPLETGQDAEDANEVDEVRRVSTVSEIKGLDAVDNRIRSQTVDQIKSKQAEIDQLKQALNDQIRSKQEWMQKI